MPAMTFMATMAAEMSEFFHSIKQGLEEAIGCSEGKCIDAAVHEFSPIDVKNIRAGMNMTQMEFASAFGLSVSTLRHWERGDRVPQGPALVLLNVVRKEPQAVLRALR
uniref:Putative transcriptional regulator n=1 Tax=Candidatus Kentrum sp. UNK TaxID=2126344 RepID=A0A451B3P1_9GAMM|nr:MAG: putative transcriptional regulator [Candidatus Kentron sp. UNK]VFK72893.1 MAG: putative transcriptional regulator [Candidatus Kentron sp. UNK]